MNHITHYKFSVTLPEKWEENVEESVKVFQSDIIKKMSFIQSITDSKVIKLKELVISFDVSAVMREDDSTCICRKDESLSTDFWIQVAQGMKDV